MGGINRRVDHIQREVGESRKNDEGKGEEKVAGRVGWVARGEYVRLLLLRAWPAIGSSLLCWRDAEEEREK